MGSRNTLFSNHELLCLAMHYAEKKMQTIEISAYSNKIHIGYVMLITILSLNKLPLLPRHMTSGVYPPDVIKSYKA